MPEPKRPLKIFLCHAHDDETAVRAFYKRLKKDGLDAWLDKEKLHAGANWEYEIRKAVRESDVVIVCLSRKFAEGGFRQKEVQIALDEAALKPKQEVFIIPVRLEECDVPEQLAIWHWLDLFRRGGYLKLMESLKSRALQVQSATVALPRTDEIIPNLVEELKPEQTKNIFVTVDGNVQGNIIVGDKNAIQTPISQHGELNGEKKEFNIRALPWGPMLMVPVVLIGGIAAIFMLIWFLLQSFKPIPSATATNTATITATMTLTQAPTATFTRMPSSATVTLTKTVNPIPTFALTLTSYSTITITTVPVSLQVTKQGITGGYKFTFRTKNVPNECNQVTCELRWTVWTGKWAGPHGYNGNPDAQGENFTTSKYDSGWIIADDKGLIFVYSLTTAFNGDYYPPYLVNFRICTDPSRSKCKTVSDLFSQNYP